MITVAHLQVNVLPLLALFILGLLAIQAASLVLSSASGRSLMAWSVSVFGVSTIYMRKPNALFRFAQLVLPLGVMVALIWWLLSLQPLPVRGFADQVTTRRDLTGALALLLSLPRLLGAFYELRFPLWGEARMIDRVARGQFWGTIFYFTSAGRTYLRDRFGATPDEFLRIVRRRQPHIATGARS